MTATPMHALLCMTAAQADATTPRTLSTVIGELLGTPHMPSMDQLRGRRPLSWPAAQVVVSHKPTGQGGVSPANACLDICAHVHTLQCWPASAWSAGLLHTNTSRVHHSIALPQSQSVAWNSNVTCLPVSLLYIPVKISSCMGRGGGGEGSRWGYTGD